MSVCIGGELLILITQTLYRGCSTRKRLLSTKCELNIGGLWEGLQFTNTGSLHSNCFTSTAFMETEIRNYRPCILGVVHGEDSSSEVPAVNPNSKSTKTQRKGFTFPSKSTQLPICLFLSENTIFKVCLCFL